MPTVLLVNGFRFFFYMNDHLPIHIHVSRGGARAKINLMPEIELMSSNGFKVKEVREILEITVANYDTLIAKWNETFN